MDYFAASRFGTKLTREIMEGKKAPSRNMWNGKPYRTAAQKRDARREAYRGNDGTFHSDAPVSWHPVPRGSVSL